MRIEGYATIISSKPFDRIIKFPSSTFALYIDLITNMDLEYDENSEDEYINERLSMPKSAVFENMKIRMSKSTFQRGWKNLESVGLIIDNKDGTFNIPMLASKIEFINFLIKELKSYLSHLFI